MKLIGIWLATFLFSLGNSLPLPTTSKVETIKVVNQEFAELRKISPQMELTEWSIKGNDLMKSWHGIVLEFRQELGGVKVRNVRVGQHAGKDKTARRKCCCGTRRSE